VLSGATAEIEKATRLLDEQGMRYKQLSVAAAFHSELVADASGPFGERLKQVDFKSTDVSVYANTTGDAYPDSVDQAKKLLAGQLARPVDFVAEIETMYAAGLRTFLEVGPGARLTGMVKAILGEREHQAIAIDASNGKRSGINDLARALAQLVVLGHPVELALWDEGYAAYRQAQDSKKSGMTVQLTGANYFKRPDKRPPMQQPVVHTAAAAQPAAATPVQQPVAAPQTAPEPAPQAVDSGSLQEALQMTRQSMQALQDLQEQTARLHQQFLAGQESTTKTFLNLVEQQNRLLQGQPVSSPAPAPVQTSAPESPVQPAAAAVAPVESAPVVSAPVVAPAADRSAVADTLLAVIAEKTGYPQEMLELEMTLDADLGIDSIKRVEILSALQEQLPEAPAVKPEDLGSLQTLGQIITHLGDGMASAPAPAAAPAAVAPTVEVSNVADTLLAVIAEKTGYPQEMLELEMTLDSDLGIDSIKRVEILSALQEQLPEAPAVKPEDLGSLQTLGQIIDHLSAGMASAAVPVESEAPVAAGVDSSRIASVLLAVIAEKTGYPQEMLEMEMALDTDLGIDSIKRVEILSALQEQLPEAPAVKPEDLGVLQTLGQIVDHLGAAETKEAAVEQPSGAVVDGKQVATVLLAVIAEKTGYPQEMLELEMALDTDLGIDSIKRVEILSALQEQLPDAPAVKPEDLGVLQTLGQIVDHLTAAGQGDLPATVPAAASPLDRGGVAATLLEVIAEKTGYPQEMLELEIVAIRPGNQARTSWYSADCWPDR
jgi:acyl carrier protein